MIVGVDVGTQSLKAVVVDEALRLLGEAAIAYQPSFPRPGWAQQDPRLWEAALAPAIGRALAAAGSAKESVTALGICGQLDGCLAVDELGRPLGDCIIWMDRRAVAEIASLPAERIRDLAGVVLDPGHMAAKIVWLKRHDPAARRAARFHQPVSYLVERLCGRAVIDHALASTTMLYGLAGRCYEPVLLSMFGVGERELPELADAGESAGQLTTEGAALAGLPSGIAIAVGTGDDFSTPLGAGIERQGRLVVAIGTGEVVGALHDAPRIDPRGLVETHAFPGGAWYIENPGWLSGGALTWFASTFAVNDAAGIDSLAADAPPGAAGVIFLPALGGAMSPEWVARARGCYYGLTAMHGRPHLARALLEGCAFAMRDVADRLRELGVRFEAIRLVGGGARSRVWAQIRADLAGLPVEIAARPDASPLGAALLAAVAGGIHDDLASGAACLDIVAETVQPDPARRAAYDDAYGAYGRLFASLRPMFTESAA